MKCCERESAWGSAATVDRPTFKSASFKDWFENSTYSDCNFIIEGKKISAHKLILASGSPVFERMFYGELACATDIIIDDINADDFHDAIKFMYTDEIPISSIQHAWNIYHIANRYLIEDLLNFCHKYLHNSLTLDTLALTYELSVLYDDKCLAKTAWQDMLTYSRGILMFDSSEHHMQLSTLKLLIKEATTLDHFDIVKSIVLWAVVENKNNHENDLADNIVKVIDKCDLTQYIKKDFDEDDILSYVENSTTDDLILDCLKSLDLLNIPREEKRLKRQAHVHHKQEAALVNHSHVGAMRHFYRPARQVDTSGPGFITYFPSSIQCDKPVLLYGFLVTTENRASDYPSAAYEGKIVISMIEDGNEETVTEYSGTFQHNVNTYVPLRQAKLLTVGSHYRIKVQYRNLSRNRGTVLLTYLSQQIVDDKNQVIIRLRETNGAVIRGLLYYPLQ